MIWSPPRVFLWLRFGLLSEDRVSKWRMTTCNAVGFTDCHNSLTIQSQCGNCCSSSWGEANDKESVHRPYEVVVPPVLTWVKEDNFLLRNRISGGDSVSFPAVAMKTCERQVIECISPTLRDRVDMINRESNILPLFRSVAVLTEAVRPLAHLSPEGSRYFTTRGQPLPVLRSREMGKIPNNAVQKAEVIVYLFVTV